MIALFKSLQKTSHLPKALAVTVLTFGSVTNAGNTMANFVSEAEQSIDALNNGDLVPLGTESLDMRNANRGQGNGRHFCQIIVLNGGILGSGIENSTLSSKNFGGRSGKASVTTTNGSFRLSVDPPIGFSAMPAGSNPTVNMFASYLASGVTNFSETPGNIRMKLRRGTTQIETHLVASTPDGEPFSAGQYSAELTLRCE